MCPVVPPVTALRSALQRPDPPPSTGRVMHSALHNRERQRDACHRVSCQCWRLFKCRPPRFLASSSTTWPPLLPPLTTKPILPTRPVSAARPCLHLGCVDSLVLLSLFVSSIFLGGSGSTR